MIRTFSPRWVLGRVVTALLLASSALLLGSSGCGGETGPTPPSGDLVVETSGGPASAEAVVLRLIGPSMSDIRVGGGLTLLRPAQAPSNSISGEFRTIIRGPLGGGRQVLLFWVPDVTKVLEYSVEIVEAAAGAGGGYQRLPTTSFVPKVVKR